MSLKKQNSGNELKFFDRFSRDGRQRRAQIIKDKKAAEEGRQEALKEQAKQQHLATATSVVLKGSATPSEEFFGEFINEVLPNALKGSPDGESQLKAALRTEEFVTAIKNSEVLTPFEEAAQPNDDYRKKMNSRRANLASALSSGIIGDLTKDDLDIILTTLVSQKGPSDAFFDFLELSAKHKKPQEYGLALAEVLKRLSDSVTTGDKKGGAVKNRSLIDGSIVQAYVAKKTAEVKGKVDELEKKLAAAFSLDPANDSGPTGVPGLGKSPEEAQKLAKELATVFADELYKPHLSVSDLDQIPATTIFSEPRYSNTPLNELLSELENLTSEWAGFADFRKAVTDFESAKKTYAEVLKRVSETTSASELLSNLQGTLETAQQTVKRATELPGQIAKAQADLTAIAEAEPKLASDLDSARKQLSATEDSIKDVQKHIDAYNDGNKQLLDARAKLASQIGTKSEDELKPANDKLVIFEKKLSVLGIAALTQRMSELTALRDTQKNRVTSLEAEQTELVGRNINLQNALTYAVSLNPTDEEVVAARATIENLRPTAAALATKLDLASQTYPSDLQKLQNLSDAISIVDQHKLQSDAVKYEVLMTKVRNFSSSVAAARLPNSVKRSLVAVCATMQSGRDITDDMKAVSKLRESYARPATTLVTKTIKDLNTDKKQTIMFLSLWRDSEKPADRQMEPTTWLGRRADDFVNLFFGRAIPREHSWLAYGMVAIPVLWHAPVIWLGKGLIYLVQKETWFFTNWFQKHHVTEEDGSKGKKGIPAFMYKVPTFIATHALAIVLVYGVIGRNAEIRTNLSDVDVSANGTQFTTGKRPQHEHASVYDPGEHWYWGAHWYSIPPFYQLVQAAKYVCPPDEACAYFFSTDGVQRSKDEGRRMHEATASLYWQQFTTTADLKGWGITNPENIQWVRDHSMQPLTQEHPESSNTVMRFLAERSKYRNREVTFKPNPDDKAFAYAMPLNREKARQLSQRKGLENLYTSAGFDANGNVVNEKYAAVRMETAPSEHRPEYILDPEKANEFVAHMRTNGLDTYEKLNLPGNLSDFISRGFLIQKDQKEWRDVLAGQVRDYENLDFLALNNADARRLLAPHIDAEKSPDTIKKEAWGEFVAAWKKSVEKGRDVETAFNETLASFKTAGKTVDTTHQYELASVRDAYAKFHPGKALARDHAKAYAIIDDASNPKVLELAFKITQAMNSQTGKLNIPNDKGVTSYGVELGDLILAAKEYQNTGKDPMDYNPVPGTDGRIGKMVPNAIHKRLFTADIIVPKETDGTATKTAESWINEMSSKITSVTKLVHGRVIPEKLDEAKVRQRLNGTIDGITESLQTLEAYKGKKPEDIKAKVAEALAGQIHDSRIDIDAARVTVTQALSQVKANKK